MRKIPREGVKELCIDMKESLHKVAEEVFPEVKVVVDHFHVVADSNRRMDEAREIEQDVLHRKKIKMPRKIFLIGRGQLNERERERIAGLLVSYPSLKGFYRAKEKMRELTCKGAERKHPG